ncbi:unnamed protein product [Blepharisma stoltei]|uniref:GRIP domain-containing protein n=1 Tax=Blepharisma stoltei TaxID=1481888 RepID=A0AAU9II06_9CILI|nr:unnamed protein product [Blepharisma stoltei]
MNRETLQQQKIFYTAGGLEPEENDGIITGLQSKLLALEQKYIDFVGKCANVLQENTSQINQETYSQDAGNKESISELLEEKKKIQNDLNSVIDEKNNIKADKKSKLKTIEEKIFELCMNNSENRKTARWIISEIKLMVGVQDNEEGFNRKFEKELQREKDKYFKLIKMKDMENLKLRKEKHGLEKMVKELNKQIRDFKNCQETPCKIRTEGSRPASRCEGNEIKKLRMSVSGFSPARSAVSGSPVPAAKHRQTSRELIKSFAPKTKEFSPLRISKSNSPISRSVSPQNKEFHNIKKELIETKQRLEKTIEERDIFKAWKINHMKNNSVGLLATTSNQDTESKNASSTIALIRAKANTVIKAAKNFIDATIRAERAILNAEADRSETLEKCENSKAKLRQIIRDFESDKFLEVIAKTSNKNAINSITIENKENDYLQKLEEEIQIEKNKNESFNKIIEEKSRENKKIKREMEKLKEETNSELKEKDKVIEDLKIQNSELKTTMKNMKEIFHQSPKANQELSKIREEKSKTEKMLLMVKNIFINEMLIYDKKIDEFSKNISHIIMLNENKVKKSKEILYKIKMMCKQNISDLKEKALNNEKNNNLINELKESNKALKKSQKNSDDTYNQKLKELNKKLRELEDTKQILEKKLENANETQDMNESSKNTEFEKLMQINSELRSEIDILEKQIKTQKKEFDAFSIQLEIEMKSEIEDLESKIKSQKEEYDNRNNQLEKELNNSREKCYDLQIINENLKTEISSNESKIQSLQENMSLIEKKEAAKIIEKDLKIEEFNENISKLEIIMKNNSRDTEEKIHNLNEKIFELNKIVRISTSKLEEKIELQGELENELNEVINENNELRSQIDSAYLELNEMKKNMQKEKNINKETKIAIAEISEKLTNEFQSEKEKIISGYNERVKELENEKAKVLSDQSEQIEKLSNEINKLNEAKLLIHENLTTNIVPNPETPTLINAKEIIDIVNKITQKDYSEIEILPNLENILSEIKFEYEKTCERNSQLEKFCIKYTEETTNKLKVLEEERLSSIAREKELKEQLQDLKIIKYEIAKQLDDAKAELSRLNDTLESEKLNSAKILEENENYNKIIDSNTNIIQNLNEEIKNLKKKNSEISADFANKKSIIAKLTDDKEYLEQRLQSAIASSQLSGNQLREHNIKLQSQLALLESSNNNFTKIKIQLESKNAELETESIENTKIIDEKSEMIDSQQQRIGQLDYELTQAKSKLEIALNDYENEKKKNIELTNRIQNEEITYQTNIDSLENELRVLKQQDKGLITRKNSAPLTEPPGDGVQFKSSNIKLFIDTSQEGLRRGSHDSENSKASGEKSSKNIQELINQLENFIEKSNERKIPESLVSLFNRYVSKPQSISIDHDIDIISSESPHKANYPQLSSESPTSSVHDHDTVSVDSSSQSQEPNYRAHFKILEQKKIIDDLNKKLANKKNKLQTTLELTKVLKENIKELQHKQFMNFDTEHLRNSFTNLVKALPPLNKESQAILQIIKSQLSLQDDVVHSEGSIRESKKGRWSIFNKKD